MNADMPDWKQDIRRGDFSNVKQWLVINVHSKGNLHDPGDLVRVVTGQDLTIEPFLTYLEQKRNGLLSG
jgi:carboxypeptidase Taq